MESFINPPARATRAVIYEEHLLHNLHQIRAAIGGGVKLCVAVKADGYGCGAVITARAAEAVGASYLAVATVGEGRALRDSGITIPILLLSMCAPCEVDEAVRLGITPLVFDKDYIYEFATAASKRRGRTGAAYPVHLAIDTGMGRIGCHAIEAADIARVIMGTGSLVLGGMCTHFAVADSVKTSDREYTQKQLARFNEAVCNVRQAGIEPGIRHCAESVALFDIPEARLDMVRAGIVTYGYYPGDMTREYFEAKGTPVDLKPVMAVESEVCAVRHFKAGESVSYGRTWTAPSDTDIAVLTIGYADGILRRWAPGLVAAINGVGYPVVGRICMDQCMLDVGTSGAVHRGDKAVLFGPRESGALCDAEDIARMTGTISYEVMTGITSRVQRVVCPAHCE